MTKTAVAGAVFNVCLFITFTAAAVFFATLPQWGASAATAAGTLISAYVFATSDWKNVWQPLLEGAKPE